MHLQQTKSGSRSSGGPQYYFHDIPENIRDYIRKKGACELVLQTPYGIHETPFLAVSAKHKLDRNRKIVSGNVGHDRVQTMQTGRSIGEEIRRWYNLSPNGDFERIDVKVVLETRTDSRRNKTILFVLTPTSVKMRGSKRNVILPEINNPLSFHKDFQSKMWNDHLNKHLGGAERVWVKQQLTQVVADHANPENNYIDEADLMRTAGAFSKLGVTIGPYRKKGYDCDPSSFKLLQYRPYNCPIEVKKKSSGFGYQLSNYTPLPRAVILCLEHDKSHLPPHIDVIELNFLAKAL